MESIVYNIYLDEPLRKIGNYVDYIDFANSKVVRNVKVVDNTGTKTLNQSLVGLSTPEEEPINLPFINLNDKANSIEFNTTIQPSNIKIKYYKEA